MTGSGGGARSDTSRLPAPAADATRPKASDEVPPAAGPIGSSSAAIQGTYRFQICNKSGEVARAAASYRESGGWIVQGWWKVNSGQCMTIGNFVPGWLYYYADADDGGSWEGSVLNKCVRYPGPWKRFEAEGESYTCRDDEQLKGFGGRFNDEVGTFTWNLNP